MVSIKAKSHNKLLFKIGVVLLVLACLLWIGIAVVPFLPLPGATKAGVVGVLIVAGEIMFWLGVILTGKEFVARYKRYLNPKHWKSNKNGATK